MAKYKMIVLTQPIAGKESEYNDWYQNVHLSQVVNVEGLTGVQRYRLAHNVGKEAVLPYLAIYDMETDDLAGVMAEMDRRAGTDRMVVSDAVDQQCLIAAVYEELGARVNS